MPDWRYCEQSIATSSEGWPAGQARDSHERDSLQHSVKRLVASEEGHERARRPWGKREPMTVIEVRE